MPQGPIEIATALLTYAAVVIGSGVAGKLAGIVVGTLRRRAI
jgi:hypothetical protein